MPHTAAKTGGHPHPPPRVRKTELAALGLIGWRPMHGYAISQVFQELGLEHWTTISRSSIYTALRRLARAGAVSITREKEGGAPERTVYHLTPAGRALLPAPRIATSISGFPSCPPSRRRQHCRSCVTAARGWRRSWSASASTNRT